MEEMSREEFLRQKADAARRIKELYRGHNMPPYPDFVSLQQNTRRAEQNTVKATPTSTERKSLPPKPQVSRESQAMGFSSANIFRFLNLPELLKSSDTLLILGIIFLLMCDNADEKLILALVFIML